MDEATSARIMRQSSHSAFTGSGVTESNDVGHCAQIIDDSTRNVGSWIKQIVAQEHHEELIREMVSISGMFNGERG